MSTKAADPADDKFNERFQMRVDKRFLNNLDRLCRAEPSGDKDRPDRMLTPSEMVRRLVDRAIERLDRKK